jgi:hypothetical protein
MSVDACNAVRDATLEHREVMSAQPDREGTESKDVEVVAAVIVRIALDAAAMGRRS